MNCHDIQFNFQPEWKEKLICSCPLGSVMIEITMGVTTVYLPTAQRWAEQAPEWARSCWEAFHAQLSAWCAGEQIPLVVDDTGNVYSSWT